MLGIMNHPVTPLHGKQPYSETMIQYSSPYEKAYALVCKAGLPRLVHRQICII